MSKVHATGFQCGILVCGSVNVYVSGTQGLGKCEGVWLVMIILMRNTGLFLNFDEQIFLKYLHGVK